MSGLSRDLAVTPVTNNEGLTMSAKIKRQLIEYELKYSKKKDNYQNQGLGSLYSPSSFLTESIMMRAPMPSPSRVLPLPSRIPSAKKSKENKPKSPSIFRGSGKAVTPQEPVNRSKSPSHRSRVSSAKIHPKTPEDPTSSLETESEELEINSVEREARAKYLVLRHSVRQQSDHLQQLVSKFQQQTAVQSCQRPVNLPPKMKSRPKSAKSFALVVRGMNRDIERQKKNCRIAYNLLSTPDGYEEYYRTSILSSSQVTSEDDKKWNERFVYAQALSPLQSLVSTPRPQSASVVHSIQPPK
eukprot:gene10406-11322_t